MKCDFVRIHELRYPLVDEKIKENGGVREFIRRAGICISTYYAIQDGRNSPTKFVIDKILDYTGLTYEEAFRK